MNGDRRLEDHGPDAGADVLGRSSRLVAAALLIVTTLLATVVSADALTGRLFRTQDVPVLIGAASLLFGLYLRPDILRVKIPARWSRKPAWSAAALAAGVLAAAAAGTWWVFGDYAMTRDELLADFDADAFRLGFLLAPLPAEWRPFSQALMPLYMLPVPGDAGWSSSYFPGNAALRALTDLVVGRSWTNPLLAAVAVVAVHRVARRLWPDDAGAALVPALLMATAPQVLAMAMTPYAMTGHLAFNMLWLWAYLRDDRRGDAGALAAGFVATGLHQILFHPVFVAPFILWLIRARRWRRAALFVGGYAAICLFWLSYWKLALAVTGLDAAAATIPTPNAFVQAVDLVAKFEPSAFLFMAVNLLRFAAWQHLLLLPLIALAWVAVRRGEGIARPLAAGMAVMTAALLILLPWQAHGWGYRYLHGFIGGACLLAGYGWRRIGAGGPGRRGGAMAAATAATLLLVLPFHLWSIEAWVRPYRTAQAVIGNAAVDVVLVDATGAFFADDLVRNAPDLSNRPLVLDLRDLDAGQLRTLCGRYRVGTFDKRHAMRAGLRADDNGDRSGERRILPGLGCGAPLP